MAEVRFDDIEAINALASEEFGEWGESIEVSQQMINDFAELTGDRQWIHIEGKPIWWPSRSWISDAESHAEVGNVSGEDCWQRKCSELRR